MGEPVAVVRMLAQTLAVDGHPGSAPQRVWVRIDDEGRVVDEVPTAVLVAAPEMQALLRELEWSGADNAGEPACPSCGAPRDLGALVLGTFRERAGTHDETCKLARLAKAAP